MKLRLTQAIKTEARRLGFALAGVTTPDPPPHYEVYERWLQSGRHGEMGYLATERACQRRGDPRQILPECQSILVLGMVYSPNAFGMSKADPVVSPSSRGRVAAYAWGDDYHEVLLERTRALVAFIEEQVGHPVPHRGYTDTGPLLERDLAQRAGLGWIGKNTLLIHPGLGSYLLLAEILLGVELVSDPPFTADRSGTCTRCLEACPTGCILPDRTLEARDCISYLTIELKGAIPPDLRPKIGNWVFGCDVCQEVCPWSMRVAATQGDPAFAPRPGIPAPDLIEELSLTPEVFNQKFRGSPVKRSKRRGYLRNVAVALGNTVAGQSGEVVSAAVSALDRALLGDPESLVRGHVAWALGHIKGEMAVSVLVGAAQVETDAWVQEEIQLALS